MADRSSKKILILVPHVDDETNIAGNAIYRLRKAGREVFIVYAINGDWKGASAATRVKEALKVAGLYGVPDDHVIFLGYSDTFDTTNNSHIFYHEDGKVISSSGHQETYGAAGKVDYAYAKRGRHSPFNRRAFIEDIADVIRDIYPDMIICSDFDQHLDHRMLTLGFDAAVKQILGENPNYRPVVLKTFAYCLAYTAISDFWEPGLPETQRPQVSVTGRYEFDIIDTSLYEWERRLRFPAPKESMHQNLLKNMKAKALRLHKSQPIIMYADRIINSDEVFWLRRTDSLSYTAKIHVSSGNPDYLNDFRLYNVDEIDSKAPRYAHYLWQPEQTDQSKEIVFSWDAPKEISMICLYGNIEESGRINKIRIEFDTGFRVDTEPLPSKGRRLEVVVPRQKNVHSCKLTILSTEGEGCGLAECEFYQDADFSDELIEELSGAPAWEDRINDDAETGRLYVWSTRALGRSYLGVMTLKWRLIWAYRLLKEGGIHALMRKVFNR